MTEFCSVLSQTSLMQLLIYSSCNPERPPASGTLLRGKDTFCTCTTAQVGQLGTGCLQCSAKEKPLEIHAACTTSNVEMLTQSRQKTAPFVQSISAMAAQWKTSISGKLAQRSHILETSNLKRHCLKKACICFAAHVLQATTGPPGYNDSVCTDIRLSNNSFRYRQIFLSGFNCANQKGLCLAVTAYCSLTGFRQSSFNSLHPQPLLIHLQRIRAVHMNWSMHTEAFQQIAAISR